MTLASKQIREGDYPTKPPPGAKVLVIGSTGHAGVTCMHWLDREIPNVADFDAVIVNAGSLTTIIRDWESATPPLDEWNALGRRLSHIEERLLQVVRTGGFVYAIVFPLATANQWKGVSDYTSSIDNLDWNPWPVLQRREAGDTKEVLLEEFERYFGTVDKWEFYFDVERDHYIFSTLERDTYRGAFRVSPRPEPIAINRQSQPIGLRFAYALHRYTQTGAFREQARWNAEPHFLSGPVIYLPPPTRVSGDEAVRIILKDFCGIGPGTTAPAWAACTQMPGAQALDEQITEKQKGIESLQSELAPLLAERERREGFKAILYETGVEPLQNVVESVFNELGLKTKPSEVSDEFIVECDGRELLMEVKGNDRSAKLTDLRQLIDYQLEHEQKHGSPIKSALVVNAWRHLPPDQRGQTDTTVFPDNVIRRARDNKIALVDTVQLYNALNHFWLGQTDGKSVFDTLFNSSGAVTLTS